MLLFFFQAEDGIRDLVRSRGLGDVYKRQTEDYVPLLPWLGMMWWGMAFGQLVLNRGWMDQLLSLIHI